MFYTICSVFYLNGPFFSVYLPECGVNLPGLQCFLPDFVPQCLSTQCYESMLLSHQHRHTFRVQSALDPVNAASHGIEVAGRLRAIAEVRLRESAVNGHLESDDWHVSVIRVLGIGKSYDIVVEVWGSF